MRFIHCKLDFEIWDTVLARCRPMRLETISRAQGKVDAALMSRAQQNRWSLDMPGPPWLLTITFDSGPVGGELPLPAHDFPALT